MQIISNPTAKLSNSYIWGFEVSHVLIAVSCMLTSNMVFTALDIPVIFSWIVSATVLLSLRLLSLGKKQGHLLFLIQRMQSPTIFLGSMSNLKKEVQP